MLIVFLHNATVALVLDSIDTGPIGGAKRNARPVHDISLGLSCSSKRLV